MKMSWIICNGIVDEVSVGVDGDGDVLCNLNYYNIMKTIHALFSSFFAFYNNRSL